ncbi:MAG: dual specificity protein phosphatase family protein [Chloroflexia bacterium]|nr:dual specificity protein phosphatase family protein [Chloroflexia bacterium]
MPAPLPNSYWVIPGRLLAGGYPGALPSNQPSAELHTLLQTGLSYFLDLTEPGELPPYGPLLHDSAVAGERAGHIVHQRRPIRDYGTPSTAEMQAILDTLENALQQGHTVYVHCWGGIGRTGTVIGCYLVRQGRSGAEALRYLEHLRQDVSTAHRQSPETEQQRYMVLLWPEMEQKRCPPA